MKSLHKGGNSIATALGRSTDYIENSEKTNAGELVDAYECDPFTAQSEFVFSKRLYEQKTGRDQGKHDVIAYHIRQSFKQGEVTAEQALEIGRELALRWTKGKHQFIIAAHTNTKNPHTHIVFNSVNLNCDGKFKDFKRSAIALRRVSDQICLENGLSIIETPKRSKGFNREEYVSGEKAPSVRDNLREIIDNSLSVGMSFEDFIAKMQATGCMVKRGKHLAFKIPSGKRFIRCDSLGEDYSKTALLERLSGKRTVATKQKVIVPIANEQRQISTFTTVPPKINILIDIQAKMQQGKGAGYEQWAKVFNLKEMAKTLIFLQENDLTDFDKLESKAQSAKDDFNDIATRIKASEKRMAEITELQKHVGSYGKTLEVYRAYRTGGYNKKFYTANESNIIIHKASKKYFDTLGLEKLPSIKSLQTEYATLATEKKKLYSRHRPARDFMHEILVTKQNAEKILSYNNTPLQTKNKQAER